MSPKSVVIVGAGHAGLALSYELARAGVEHLVLERGRVGESWRTRWDSFCLVTPNWTVQIPGATYAGADPDGFMPRNEIVDHLERYAVSFRAPIQEGVDVSSVEPAPGNGLFLRTSAGDHSAETVVLATGAYQKPHRPLGADSLPAEIHVIDSEAYTNPGALPPGKVLIVGSGQTGCQISEELNRSGREVVLACGRAPWGPRRIDGRDIVSWIVDTPFLEHEIADLPTPLARLGANVQATGKDGGHDLHFRTLVRDGVRLAGHFIGAEDHFAIFAPDLAESVAFGDARYADIGNMLVKSCLERGEVPPHLPTPEPFNTESPERIDLRGYGAAIFTSGFRPDYTSWVHFPNAFDHLGFPIQEDGESSIVPGLYFIGTHFLRKRKSATFLGIAEDAAVVAQKIVNGQARALTTNSDQ
jgi:putative flavoprotein involved in K+ transport